MDAFLYREDVSANLNALEVLHAKFNTQLLLIESGGDNLAANYRQVQIHAPEYVHIELDCLLFSKLSN